MFVPAADLDTPIVSSWIESIDYFGRVQIYFNASMRTDFDMILLK